MNEAQQWSKNKFESLKKLSEEINSHIQINMSEPTYCTVKTDKKININDICKIKNLLQEITDPNVNVDFVVKKNEKEFIFIWNHLNKEIVEYNVNPEAIRKRKIPELTENTTLCPIKKQDIIKDYAIVITLTTISAIILSFLIISHPENYEAIIKSVTIALISISIALIIYYNNI